jgi:hypothetical protein
MAQVVLDLLPVLAGLYLLDAVCWVPAGQVLLVVGRGGGRLLAPGLRLAPLLPGARGRLSTWPPPLAGELGLDVPRLPGLTGARRFDPASYRRLRWEETGTLRRDGSRVVDGEGTVVVSAATAAEAERWWRAIEELRDASDRRRRLDRLVAEAQDLDGLSGRLSAADRVARPLTAAGWGLLFLLFVGSPLAAGLPPLRPALPGVLLGAAGAWALCVAYGIGLARTLAAQGVTVPRGGLLAGVLVPAAAARLAVSLRVLELAGCDLAVAVVAAAPRSLAADVLRRELVGSDHALAASDEPGWQDHWRRRHRVLLRLALSAGFEEDWLLAPPRRQAEAASYCSLCGGQFRLAAGSCDECGLDLRPFVS